MTGKRKGKSFKYHPIKWDPSVFDEIEEAVRNGHWEDPTKFIKEAVRDKLDKVNTSEFKNHTTIRNLKGEVVAEIFYD